jgi:hypothetical protein
MVDLAQKSLFERSLLTRLFWVGFGGCIFGLGLPSVTGVRLFLVFLSATVLGSLFLALRAPRRSVLVASALMFVASNLILNVVTDELGWLTDPVFVLAFWFSLIVWPVVLIGLLRLAFGGRRMVILAAILAVGIFGVGARTILMDTGGYVSKHLYLPTARMTVEGKPSGGYVHSLSWDTNRILVVTRRRHLGGETYWLWNSGRPGRVPGAVRCYTWTAPPFPAVLTTDTYQPCLSVEPGAPQPDRNVAFGANFAEFTADDSKRVRVVW